MKTKYLTIYLTMVLVSLGVSMSALASSDNLFALKPENEVPGKKRFSSEMIQAANLVIYKPVRDCIEMIEKRNNGYFQIDSITEIKNQSDLIYEIEGATLIGGDVSTGEATIEVFRTSTTPWAPLTCKIK